MYFDTCAPDCHRVRLRLLIKIESYVLLSLPTKNFLDQCNNYQPQDNEDTANQDQYYSRCVKRLGMVAMVGKAIGTRRWKAVNNFD